jgi:hypothetical protein
MDAGALLGTLIGDVVAKDTFGHNDKLKLSIEPVNGQPLLTGTYRY